MSSRRPLPPPTPTAHGSMRTSWAGGDLEPRGEAAGPSSSVPDLGDGVRVRQQRIHGYTREDLRLLVAPMAVKGEEPLGAMGDDSALAVLSEAPQLLYAYFKQLFAQVTNPPIDPLRESLVMSLRTLLGAQGNLFSGGPEHCRQIALDSPVLSDARPRGHHSQPPRESRLLAPRCALPRPGGGAARGREPAAARGGARGARWRLHPGPERSRRGRPTCPDPRAARGRRRPSSPDSPRAEAADLHRGGERRSARGHARLPASRLRRERRPIRGSPSRRFAGWPPTTCSRDWIPTRPGRDMSARSRRAC